MQFCIPPSNETQSDKPRWKLARCSSPSISLGRPLLSPRRALRKNLPRKFKIMMDRIAVMMSTRMEWIKMSARPRASRTDWPSIRLIAARLSDCPMLRLSLSINSDFMEIIVLFRIGNQLAARFDKMPLCRLCLHGINLQAHCDKNTRFWSSNTVLSPLGGRSVLSQIH